MVSWDPPFVTSFFSGKLDSLISSQPLFYEEETNPRNIVFFVSQKWAKYISINSVPSISVGAHPLSALN